VTCRRWRISPAWRGMSRKSGRSPRNASDYLRHLLEDNREGSRAGFPQPVAEEILLLIEILKATSGADQGDAGKRSTTWSMAPKMLAPLPSSISIRTRSPKRMKGVAGLPLSMVSYMRSSAMQQ
jgi:hypothetical protein